MPHLPLICEEIYAMERIGAMQ